MDQNKKGFIVIFFAILGFIWLFLLSPLTIQTPDPTIAPSSAETESSTKAELPKAELPKKEVREDDFDEVSAFSLIETLAYDYEGRMAGTQKNQDVVELLSNEFDQIGLTAPSGGYKQAFEAFVPVFGDTFILEVKDSQGELIRSYRLRKDFAFGSSNYAGGGDIESTFREIRHSSDDEEDLIVLHPEGARLPQQQREFMNRGIKAVITTASSIRGDQPEYIIKATSVGQAAYKQGNQIILGYVTPKVYDQLANDSRQGRILHIVNDLSFENVTLNNVVGILPGTDENLPPLVISAHLDHVGTDPDGVIFHGAFDNASGTSMVVHLAKAMASKEQQPKRTLIFAAFNGEEIGLLGSIAFLQNPPVDYNYEVINFDMIGTDPDFPLAMDGIAKNSYLLEELLEAAEEWEIPADASTTGEYASDHMPFLQSGLNAFTLIQLDMQRIHTPDDDPSDIHLEQYDKIGEMMEDFLTAYAYE